MQKIYDEMRKYIMMTGGDIMKFFFEADTDRDNFLSK